MRRAGVVRGPMRSDAADAAAFRFSRDDVVSRNGLAIWREVIGRTILQLDIALLPDRPFHSEAAVQMSPGLHLTFATKSGLRMERSRALLADGKDDFGLHICTAGTWVGSHR